MAHSKATILAALERLEFTRDKINENSEWHGNISRAINGGHSPESVKAWLKSRDGQSVDTMQVDIVLENGAPVAMRSPWCPLARVIDSSRATYATFNGSRRDYAGMVGFFANDREWVGFTDSMSRDSITLIVYRVA